MAAAVSGQRRVSGYVLRTNGDTVTNAKVICYPDTLTDTVHFATIVDSTDFKDSFVFILPPDVPVGGKFIIATLDCDSVTFVTKNLAYTGANMSNQNLTICVTPTTTFAGYVYLGSPGKRPPVAQAMVYLISKCPGDVLTYIDSVETDTNGFFLVDDFPTLGSGCQLVMKAALKTTAGDYKKYLPAYHQVTPAYSLRWSGGKEISQPDSKNGVNILLPEAMNPHGGPSVIAGLAVDSGTNTRLPDKVIFITDMHDVPVDHTFTDHNGNFSFTNIPFGTYKLFGDVWGKDNPDLVVTVDADHVNILNIVFTENTTEFRGSIALSVARNTELQNTLSVYPIPASDIVYISGAEKIAGNKQATLTAISGAAVYSHNFSAGEDINIPVQTLPRGMYILRLATGAGTATFRVVK